MHFLLYIFFAHDITCCLCVCQSFSCVRLCDPMDCSPPGSSVQGILQARVLEWVAISFSRRSSWSRDWTHISCIAGRFFTVWATKEVPSVFRYKNSVVGEETEAHWLPTPGLYLPVQSLAYTLLLSTPSRMSCIQAAFYQGVGLRSPSGGLYMGRLAGSSLFCIYFRLGKWCDIKSKFKEFSYSSSRWIVKQWRHFTTSTPSLAQELLTVHSAMEVQEVLKRKQEPWRWGTQWSAFSSVQFSHSVMSNSSWPYGPQHVRPPCPSPTPGVYSNSSPFSRWCHPTISSSVVPFSSHLQSFSASGSFQMSQLFASGVQSIGVSASASVLPMNTQDWSPLGWTGWISLQSNGLSRVFSNTTVKKHEFFSGQPSEIDNDQLRGSSKLILLQLQEKLKNSTSTILQSFRVWSKLEGWKIQYFGASWANLKQNRKIIIFKCCSLILRNNNEPFLNQIVTCNEKWIVYNWQWPAQWLNWVEAPKHFPKPNLHQKKDMVTICCCAVGLIHYNFLNPGEAITCEKDAQVVHEMHHKLQCLQTTLINKKGSILLHDNALPQVTQLMLQKLKELGNEVLSHPSYSPDLSPTNYHFFKHLDNFLQTKCFHNQQDIQSSLNLKKHAFLHYRYKQSYFSLEKVSWL